MAYVGGKKYGSKGSPKGMKKDPSFKRSAGGAKPMGGSIKRKVGGMKGIGRLGGRNKR